MNNNNIVFSDEDDQAYCDSPCDALLIEHKDGSMICSYCGRVYMPNSVNKHHTDLTPAKGYYSEGRDGPELVPMIHYTETQKKKASVFDKEDKYIESQKSGFHFTESEDLVS